MINPSNGSGGKGLAKSPNKALSYDPDCVLVEFLPKDPAVGTMELTADFRTVSDY